MHQMLLQVRDGNERRPYSLVDTDLRTFFQRDLAEDAHQLWGYWERAVEGLKAHELDDGALVR